MRLNKALLCGLIGSVRNTSLHSFKAASAAFFVAPMREPTTRGLRAAVSCASIQFFYLMGRSGAIKLRWDEACHNQMKNETVTSRERAPLKFLFSFLNFVTLYGTNFSQLNRTDPQCA